MTPYRVFVSYSHEDVALARQVVSALERNGMVPVWDKKLTGGTGFDEQLKVFIAHSHVFVPILTPLSSSAGWVHQEIGYAMGSHVPVLPVCQGQVPGEMLQMLHGVFLDKTEDIPRVLSWAVFDGLVRRAEALLPPLFTCAALLENRSEMIAHHARQVRDMGAHGHVRQKGGLSSFGIPNHSLQHPFWKQRFGDQHRSVELFRLLREERLKLEEHARAEGCTLLVYPGKNYRELGPEVKRIRIGTLIEFIESMPEDKLRVLISRNPLAHSVTIVGNWFVAESITADLVRGYRHTIFTRHAPTVQSRIEEFDQEVLEAALEPENQNCTSRPDMIAYLRSEMER